MKFNYEPIMTFTIGVALIVFVILNCSSMNIALVIIMSVIAGIVFGASIIMVMVDTIISKHIN